MTKVISLTLILAHLLTFGPIREALAFSASSASYRMTSATLNEGGRTRKATSVSNTKLLLHCDGADGSTNITDETGRARIAECLRNCPE